MLGLRLLRLRNCRDLLYPPLCLDLLESAQRRQRLLVERRSVGMKRGDDLRVTLRQLGVPPGFRNRRDLPV